MSHKVIVNGIPRSGTTYLYRAIAGLPSGNTTPQEVFKIKKPFDIPIVKTHSKVEDAKQEGYRGIFVFRNPLWCITSIKKNIYDKVAFRNLETEYPPKGDIYEEDIFGLEERFDSWNKDNDFPVLMIRYSTIPKYKDVIEQFIGKKINLPPWKVSKGVHESQENIDKIKINYARFIKKVESMPDIKMFNWSTRSFNFRDKIYYYMNHDYNSTSLNERSIEIPIVWDIVKKYIKEDKRILEVGNVLSHYYNVSYDIVDKYEVETGVRNVDINEYKPHNKYDLVVCVSTLEHIGRSVQHTIDTLNNMKSMLVDGGKLVVTVPIGESKYINSALTENLFAPSKVFYMKRLDAENNWKQVHYDEAIIQKYRAPFRNANAIAIIIYGE